MLFVGECEPYEIPSDIFGDFFPSSITYKYGIFSLDFDGSISYIMPYRESVRIFGVDNFENIYFCSDTMFDLRTEPKNSIIVPEDNAVGIDPDDTQGYSAAEKEHWEVMSIKGRLKDLNIFYPWHEDWQWKTYEMAEQIYHEYQIRGIEVTEKTLEYIQRVDDFSCNLIFPGEE